MGEFAKNEGAKFAGRLVQQNIEYYVNVVNLGLDLTHDAFAATLSPTDEKPAKRAETDSVSSSRSSGQTEIHFSRMMGEKQNRAFIVANKQPEDVEVSFEISEFVAEDGKSRVRIPVSFEPAHFMLKTGQEQVVECQLAVTDVLTAGQRYQALARVAGFDDMLIRLSIASE
ncbi:MAG: hypothetical protein JMN24_17580 [gamma proteobacterium endosymbiont of Lamellibrachia anaximandri]|nr:hypothetical protein [gamma proteobacterium endosymbiont of Lamellibrachia anaximandri]MBL3619359.1 hypothetical protein [gamma proteobacterium endosymbiont of Lamellibrachia anaximandri]